MNLPVSPDYATAAFAEGSRQLTRRRTLFSEIQNRMIVLIYPQWLVSKKHIFDGLQAVIFACIRFQMVVP